MKTLLVKHKKNYFGFRKDQMYVNGTLRNVFTVALGKLRFYLM
jgi:hypothetical protein